MKFYRFPCKTSSFFVAVAVFLAYIKFDFIHIVIKKYHKNNVCFFFAISASSSFQPHFKLSKKRKTLINRWIRVVHISLIKNVFRRLKTSHRSWAIYHSPAIKMNLCVSAIIASASLSLDDDDPASDAVESMPHHCGCWCKLTAF